MKFLIFSVFSLVAVMLCEDGGEVEEMMRRNLCEKGPEARQEAIECMPREMKDMITRLSSEINRTFNELIDDCCNDSQAGENMRNMAAQNGMMGTDEMKANMKECLKNIP
uniref:U101-Liphistoxin-Lsp1a_2 n=2 Tax=Liphistius TaxID=62150 RepID=A0A4Q8K3Z3_9ARAC